MEKTHPDRRSVPAAAAVWSADNGDGTYKNPVLYADYSDPDVIRLGRDYYLTASSFTCLPGLPILHSPDLVNWTLLAHALPAYPEARFAVPQHGRGVWAPALRHHNRLFYLYWGDPDSGVYCTRAKTPAGPWDTPVLVLTGKGIIDPCPFWDDDGRAYLVHAWAASRAGINSLLTLRNMTADGLRVSTTGQHIFDGHEGHPTIEGPKVYKRNGYYYIFAPAGGVPQGWQTVLRSKTIDGPYEARIVMAQGTTPVNGPHQGGWVETPSGQSWFLHFQDAGPYGRIIHLQPMRWTNDWPVIGIDKDGKGIGEPVLTHPKPDIPGNFPRATPADSDAFDAETLGLQWQWQANPNPAWWARIPGTAFLRLYAIPTSRDEHSLYNVPNLLLQKFPAPEFTAAAKLTLTPEQDGNRAGLIVFGQDYACLSMTRKENRLWLTRSVCLDAPSGSDEQIAEQCPLETNTVYVKVHIAAPDARCTFSYSADGEHFTPVGSPFMAKPGRWIGAKVGLFCVAETPAPTGGYADVEWFRIETP